MKKKESFLLSKNQNINYLTALLYDPLKRVYMCTFLPILYIVSAGSMALRAEYNTTIILFDICD